MYVLNFFLIFIKLNNIEPEMSKTTNIYIYSYLYTIYFPPLLSAFEILTKQFYKILPTFSHNKNNTFF